MGSLAGAAVNEEKGVIHIRKLLIHIRKLLGAIVNRPKPSGLLLARLVRVGRPRLRMITLSWIQLTLKCGGTKVKELHQSCSFKPCPRATFTCKDYEQGAY